LGEQGMAEIVRLIPMGRLARPEEIARAVRFLISEENSYLTGQQLIVDGGFTCA
jgi:3-oxoacyl-[acyl-carrier protein] reductase